MSVERLITASPAGSAVETSAPQDTTGRAAQVSYSDVAHPAVPMPTVRMRERVLFYLRSLADGETVTAKEMTDHLRRNRLPDYLYSRCLGDLRVLEESGLAWSTGHPHRWSAIR